PFKESYLLSCFTAENSGVDLLSLFEEYGAAGSMTEVTCIYRKKEGDIKKNIADYLCRKMPLAATVADIMSTPVKGFAPTAMVQEAYKMLDLSGYTAFPLLEGEFVRGIITATDIRKAFRHGFKEAPLSDFMTPVENLTEECSLAKALALHIKHGSDLIPVVDYENKIKGVVTRTDLLRGLYKERYPAAFSAATFLPGGYDNINKLLKERLSAYTLGLLRVIGQTADKYGVSVYAVGGFVRDIFLNIQNHDIDIAVEGDALAFAGKVKEILGGKLELNEEYGTAKLSAKNFTLDFITARQEFYPLPAARPSLAKTNIKKDLFRRDFTLNTLAFKVNTGSFAQFFDYYNGLDDLKHKRIKVLYSLSFVEDPLRIIRAIKYGARLDFRLEENTLKLLRSAVRSRVLEKVTREKLTKELVLLFREYGVARIIKKLEDEEILQQIFPKVTLKEENYRLLREIEETARWREKNEKGKINVFLLFICAILYNSTGSSAIMSRLRRLSIARKEIEEIIFILENAGSIGKMLENDKLSPEEVYSIFNPLSEEMRCFILAAAKDDTVWEHYYHYRRLNKIKPALNGEVLKELGYKPGPFYKRILDRIKIEKIKGNLKSFEEEIEFIRKYIPQGGEDDTGYVE
ncbi:MAG TPA: CBS domain-containing protein, partial [Firmicutes bacterium]|nr:CBS domain-containing protein [Bacillota bacterium]